jgi:hypothetical protein
MNLDPRNRCQRMRIAAQESGMGVATVRQGFGLNEGIRLIRLESGARQPVR